jgi:hypothetical protein
MWMFFFLLMLELRYYQHHRQQQQHLWAAESITIREQQQNQMGRTQDIIAHLKAEQENKVCIKQ